MLLPIRYTNWLIPANHKRYEVGLGLAHLWGMSPLAKIFRFRAIQQKCAAGVPLELHELDELANVEGEFAPRADDLRAGRRHRRLRFPLTTIVRGTGDDLNDLATVIDLSLGGVACQGAPAIIVGDTALLVFDEPDGCISYRIKATTAWVRMRVDGTATMGFTFVGAAIMLRYGAAPLSASELFDELETRHAA